MNKVKIWVFKESGKFYTEEYVSVPTDIVECYEITDYISENYKLHGSMYIVIPMEEEFIRNPVPSMIPIGCR